MKISKYEQKTGTIHLCAMFKINNRTKSYWKRTFVGYIGKSIVYCHLSVGECIQIYWRIQSQHRPLHKNKKERMIIKEEKILKAWLWSHHLHLQWKFKLWAGKFAWGVKAKHCWTLSTNFLYSKAFCIQNCWEHPAMFCLYNFFAHNLNFHWGGRDRI